MIDQEWRRGVLDAMEECARRLNVQGVAAVTAVFGKSDTQFFISYQVVGRKERPPEPELRGKHDKGSNYIAIVTSKLAEMMSTLYSSGAQTRPLRMGELGFKGGLFVNYRRRLYFFAFSGGTPEQDLQIAEAGIKKLTS